MIASRKVGPRSGFTAATFYIPPAQLDALHAEARSRAEKVGRFRADASAVLREVLDAWLKGRSRMPRKEV